jgi:hypothetical protein
MNIVERGRAFLQGLWGLWGLAGRKVWEWRRCPHCGETEACTWGRYQRRPWFLSGRQTVRVQRHRCHSCGRTYAEGSALLVRGGWYATGGRAAAVPRFLGTAGAAGAVAALAAAGPGPASSSGLPAECEHDPAVAGSGGAATQARQTLVGLIRAVYDAPTEAEAQAALARLAAHALGQALAALVALHLEAARFHRCGYNQGLGRASPEWLWRDFRLGLGHGRNHGTEQRLERAALLWAIDHNFQPAQDRSERTRQYRHPGQAPLARAGLPPGDISSLDALAV